MYLSLILSFLSFFLFSFINDIHNIYWHLTTFPNKRKMMMMMMMENKNNKEEAKRDVIRIEWSGV